ncbi:recombinase zinc beta ribbon domain-containing protein [Geobacter sp.]|uniref:recombinase zinc beta ribbon domain-containing protein n=1 Tax=Geobacter sp. TaxID=46610 RepID=UPI0034555CF2
MSFICARHIVVNPIYYGYLFLDGILYHGNHEPIISKELFDKVQDVLAGKGRCPMSPQKHLFTYQGMVTCGRCGCAMVAEIKKEKYIYYHCTGGKGKCHIEYVREEELERQFRASLAKIRLSQPILDLVVRALKESHDDEKSFHDEAVGSLEHQRQMLQRRLDALYADKLDGVVSHDDYQRMSTTWKQEQDRLIRKIGKHQASNHSYLDAGIKLLELAQNADRLYSTQDQHEKRRILNLVLSNSSWSDGALVANYRKPFDLLAVTMGEWEEKKAVNPMDDGLRSIWLPNPDSNQGQGG